MEGRTRSCLELCKSKIEHDGSGPALRCKARVLWARMASQYAVFKFIGVGAGDMGRTGLMGNGGAAAWIGQAQGWVRGQGPGHCHPLQGPDMGEGDAALSGPGSARPPCAPALCAWTLTNRSFPSA